MYNTSHGIGCNDKDNEKCPIRRNCYGICFLAEGIAGLRPRRRRLFKMDLESPNPSRPSGKNARPRSVTRRMTLELLHLTHVGEVEVVSGDTPKAPNVGLD